MLLAFAALFAQMAPVPAGAPPLPKLVDSKPYRATELESADIAKCVEQLTAVEHPDIGFAPLMNGGGFLPVPDLRSFQGGILMRDHGLSTAPALERLVSLGPKAIPALLAALSDATPTKMRFDREENSILSGMGLAWYGHEIPTSATSKRELAARAEFPTVFAEVDSSDHETQLTAHRFTRADIAFVALGQIVNRPYAAMRYQPTACQVINSPVHDPLMAAALRRMWSSDDPARLLFESLVSDAFTDGDREVDRQGALARLVYYFPEEFIPYVVQCLDAPMVSAASRVASQRPDLSLAEWCKSVAWSSDPRLLAALGRVVERMDDPLVLIACFTRSTAPIHAELFTRVYAKMLEAAPVERGRQVPGMANSTWDPRSFGLRSFVALLPGRAEALLRVWLAHGTTAVKLDVIEALSGVPAPLVWAPALLRPFLSDETVMIRTYGPDYDARPLQVRDVAAAALADHLPGATFEFEGDRDDLNRGIARLLSRLDGKAVAEETKKAPPALAEIPRVAPLREIQLGLGANILAISDEEHLYVTNGYREDGWRLDVLALDPRTGAISSRRKIDTWSGGVVTVTPSLADRIVCFMPDGDLVVRDPKTGAEKLRVATGLHAGMDPADPLKISGLGDLAVTSDGRYAFAWTSDGMIHTFDLLKGERFAKPLGTAHGIGFGRLLPIEGTHRVLFESMDEFLRFDTDSRASVRLQRVPTGGWRSAWGRYACNAMNDNYQVFDLDEAKRIDLDLPQESKIRDVLGDAQTTRAFMRDESGPILVVDLATGICLASLTAPRGESWSSMTLSADRRRLYFLTVQIDKADRGAESRNERARIVTFDVESLLR